MMRILLPLSQEKLIRTKQVQNKCLEKFRVLWYNEYLLSLREKPQRHSRVPFQNRLKVGDMVLVRASLKPRPFWVLAIVLELLSGEDSVVRTATVKQGFNAIQVNSLKYLFPFELFLSLSKEYQV